MRINWAAAILGLVLLVFPSCTSAPSRGVGGDTGSPPPSTGPKRIMAAIRGDPPSFARERTNPSGTVSSVPGLDALQELVHVGLVHSDDKGTLLPVLSEAVPSVDNGLWQLLPDGQMVT